MQNQNTLAEGEIGKIATKLARRARGHGWSFVDAEDYQQDYRLAQFERGVSLEEFEKTQHFHLSNRASPDGKNHRVCGASSGYQGGDGDYIDALDHVQSHYTEYPVGLMTDYQRRVFAYLAELDEEKIMQTLGVRIDRAKQVLNRATDLLIRVAANPDDYRGFFENLEIQDFDAWFAIVFRRPGCGRKPGKKGGGQGGQGWLFDDLEGGEA
jgi:hypothetical protein